MVSCSSGAATLAEPAEDRPAAADAAGTEGRGGRGVVVRAVMLSARRPRDGRVVATTGGYPTPFFQGSRLTAGRARYVICRARRPAAVESRPGPTTTTSRGQRRLWLSTSADGPGGIPRPRIRITPDSAHRDPPVTTEVPRTP